MIPKTIHYCWLGGGEKPRSVVKCIESWKKYCPDYDIKEWNERNYDVAGNPYVLEACQAKKWSFATDYMRLDIVRRFGGIYLDTDVELIRSPDELLNNGAYAGFERPDDGQWRVATGLGFGAEKDHPAMDMLISAYNGIHFIRDDGSMDMTPCPQRNTEPLIKAGLIPDNSLQQIAGMIIYPSEWFCPRSFLDARTHITKNTFSIHHYSATWKPQSGRLRAAVLSRFGALGGKLLPAWKKLKRNG